MTTEFLEGASVDERETCEDAAMSRRRELAAAPLLLLVEDFPDTRDSLSLLLRAAGFRVELAENGEDGVTKAKQLLPDVILMDLRMPVLDGSEATRRIHENAETRRVPVVAISG